MTTQGAQCLRVDGVRSHVVIKVNPEHVFDLAAVLSNGFVFFDYYAMQTKSTEKDLMSQVVTLVKLVLVMPPHCALISLSLKPSSFRAVPNNLASHTSYSYCLATLYFCVSRHKYT